MVEKKKIRAPAKILWKLRYVEPKLKLPEVKLPKLKEILKKRRKQL
jgi:hypothetical protein